MSSTTLPPEITILPYGATLQNLYIGKHNIVQSLPTPAHYTTHNTPYFGATIGRIANRTANAKFTANNGTVYSLAANNGTANLHGGNVGWDKQVWEGPVPVGVRGVPGLEGALDGKLEEGGESVLFTLRSKDGDEGFPGEVLAKVIYTAGKQTVGGKSVTVLAMEYEVELVGGADETVVNMTNHSYFNLSDRPTIEGTVVELSTIHHLPLSAAGIPNAPTAPYPSLTTSTPFTLGATEPDLDDCFVFPTDDPSSIPLDTRSLPLRSLVKASHPDTGVHLEVLSTEPAFQFYTGKYIDVPELEGTRARGPRAGFCVEPSRYVNAVNRDEWRGQVLLKRGEVYGSRIVYRGWVE